MSIRKTPRDIIREHILEVYMYDSSSESLNDEASFVETGIFDSTAVMELILFLEDEFKIKVSDEEFLPENLDSISRICAFLERKGIEMGNPAQAG